MNVDLSSETYLSATLCVVIVCVSTLCVVMC